MVVIYVMCSVIILLFLSEMNKQGKCNLTFDNCHCQQIQMITDEIKSKVSRTVTMVPLMVCMLVLLAMLPNM